MAGVANDHFAWRLQGFYSQPRHGYMVTMADIIDIITTVDTTLWLPPLPWLQQPVHSPYFSTVDMIFEITMKKLKCCSQSWRGDKKPIIDESKAHFTFSRGSELSEKRKNARPTRTQTRTSLVMSSALMGPG